MEDLWRRLHHELEEVADEHVPAHALVQPQRVQINIPNNETNHETQRTDDTNVKNIFSVSLT